jgi:hypothetical protein
LGGVFSPVFTINDNSVKNATKLPIFTKLYTNLWDHWKVLSIRRFWWGYCDSVLQQVNFSCDPEKIWGAWGGWEGWGEGVVGGDGEVGGGWGGLQK